MSFVGSSPLSIHTRYEPLLQTRWIDKHPTNVIHNQNVKPVPCNGQQTRNEYDQRTAVVREFRMQQNDDVPIEKVKAVPLQVWSGPEGSRKLRFPGFMTTAQDGGRVCQPYAPAAFTSRKCSCYSFLLEADSTPGP